MYWYSTSVSHGVENISLGCGVRASLMLFSSIADEGEISDLESTGPDREELLEGDQELSAEQSYRETLRGVR